MARITRYLLPQVRRDPAQKMVFIAGPRQVGKTTLARSLNGGSAGYLNWDVAENRERILKGEPPPGKLWIFDEIHKYRRWRNYLKGLYDGRAAASVFWSREALAWISIVSEAIRCKVATIYYAFIPCPSQSSA